MHVVRGGTNRPCMWERPCPFLYSSQQSLSAKWVATRYCCPRGTHLFRRQVSSLCPSRGCSGALVAMVRVVHRDVLGFAAPPPSTSTLAHATGAMMTAVRRRSLQELSVSAVEGERDVAAGGVSKLPMIVQIRQRSRRRSKLIRDVKVRTVHVTADQVDAQRKTYLVLQNVRQDIRWSEALCLHNTHRHVVPGTRKCCIAGSGKVFRCRHPNCVCRTSLYGAKRNRNLSESGCASTLLSTCAFSSVV